MTTNEIKPSDGPTDAEGVTGGDCGASSCSLIDAIREVEKWDFRTEHDSGAHPNAMLLMNRLRRMARLPSITKHDLPAWDGKAYVMPPNSNLLANDPHHPRRPGNDAGSKN